MVKKKSEKYLNDLQKNDNLKDFADKLKKLRKNRNVSQILLSEKSNLSKNYIQEIESLFVNPSLDSIFKICNALDIHISTIFLDIEKDSKLIEDINNYFSMKSLK